MKPLSSAIAAALILFSAQGVAEQTTQPVVRGRLREGAESYAKALASDILR